MCNDADEREESNLSRLSTAELEVIDRDIENLNLMARSLARTPKERSGYGRRAD